MTLEVGMARIPASVAVLPTVYLLKIAGSSDGFLGARDFIGLLFTSASCVCTTLFFPYSKHSYLLRP